MTEPSTYPQQLRLVHYPHPALRKTTSAVTIFDSDLRNFCQRMIECMYDSNGVGLAAPQVAVSKRIFVTDHERSPENPAKPRVWINPRIENGIGEVMNEEGCLSFPGMYAKIQRLSQLDLVAQDVHGKESRTTLDVEDTFLTIIVQHELDHLDGMVFLDHLSFLQLSSLKRKIKEMEKDYKKETGQAGSVLRR